ncbi:helix-turn-helix domain-containing protein [Solihabitans fulvus]|uniref:helix-turn-helix domain-containing protein n=1 Tax=Solihabitans fulvus TaxID=1892852 RepID=UPI001CB76763|nr:helix-turn-helix domain-containing protein [Solihabitans fulvus]
MANSLLITLARYERGLDVSMTAIARHAGVGVATLYRRFPPRNRWSPRCSPTSSRHTCRPWTTR